MNKIEKALVAAKIAGLSSEMHYLIEFVQRNDEKNSATQESVDVQYTLPSEPYRKPPYHIESTLDQLREKNVWRVVNVLGANVTPRESWTTPNHTHFKTANQICMLWNSSEPAKHHHEISPPFKNSGPYYVSHRPFEAGYAVCNRAQVNVTPPSARETGTSTVSFQLATEIANDWNARKI